MSEGHITVQYMYIHIHTGTPLIHYIITGNYNHMQVSNLVMTASCVLQIKSAVLAKAGHLEVKRETR